MQQPTIGRAVHYYASADQKEPFAATVSYVHNATCINVGYLTHGGSSTGMQTSVPYGETAEGHPGFRWCWPPRV
jgi:hypothetical protein